MNRRIGIVLGAAVALLALAGCSSGGAGGGYGSPPSGASSSASVPSSSAPSASTGATLSTASTALGTVIVNAKGYTVYVFDKDTANSGKSVCTGACAALWPAVVADSATPKVHGVTGKVGTITESDGKLQVTINGLPLYTFAQDTSAGEATGQGFSGIWWVVGADGAKVTSATPSSHSGGGY